MIKRVRREAPPPPCPGSETGTAKSASEPGAPSLIYLFTQLSLASGISRTKLRAEIPRPRAQLFRTLPSFRASLRNLSPLPALLFDVKARSSTRRRATPPSPRFIVSLARDRNPVTPLDLSLLLRATFSFLFPRAIAEYLQRIVSGTSIKHSCETKLSALRERATRLQFLLSYASYLSDKTRPGAAGGKFLPDSLLARYSFFPPGSPSPCYPWFIVSFSSLLRVLQHVGNLPRDSEEFLGYLLINSSPVRLAKLLVQLR